MISTERAKEVIERDSEINDELVAEYYTSEIDPENCPNTLEGIGRNHREIANCHGLLGNEQEARESYARGAEYYRDAKRFVMEHRDELEENRWEDAPAYMFNAIECAVISQDDTILEEIAAETIEMDEAYLAEFADKYEDSPFRFYNAKLYATMAVHGEQREHFLDEYWNAIEGLESQDAEDLGEFYQGLMDGDPEIADAYLGLQHFNHQLNLDPDTVSPELFVDDENLAYCLLANDWDISITFDSPYIPTVLVPDPATAEYVIEANPEE